MFLMKIFESKNSVVFLFRLRPKIILNYSVTFDSAKISTNNIFFTYKVNFFSLRIYKPLEARIYPRK